MRFNPAWLLLLVIMLNPAHFVRGDDTVANGSRIKLSIGQLFVPSGFVVSDSQFDLVVHLHGAPSVVEKNLWQSGVNAVLVNVTLNGLSAVYTQQFSKPETFTNLLDEVQEQIEQHLKLTDRPKLRRVMVVSFSAGFGGVRELLKSDVLYDRIDAIVMADSIYAGYTPDSKPSEVDPKAMTGFLKFARDAAAGKKVLVISHCELRPETYASTAETADYLLRELKLERKPVDEEWERGWKCLSRCEEKGLKVFGFAGDTGKHHMQHLQNAGRLMQLAKAID